MPGNSASSGQSARLTSTSNRAFCGSARRLDQPAREAALRDPPADRRRQGNHHEDRNGGLIGAAEQPMWQSRRVGAFGRHRFAVSSDKIEYIMMAEAQRAHPPADFPPHDLRISPNHLGPTTRSRLAAAAGIGRGRRPRPAGRLHDSGVGPTGRPGPGGRCGKAKRRDRRPGGRGIDLATLRPPAALVARDARRGLGPAQLPPRRDRRPGPRHPRRGAGAAELFGPSLGRGHPWRHYVEAVAAAKARIYDTRKTTPGWRRLEKYAVRCGGGWNHRTGLFAAVLIKDNHLALWKTMGSGKEGMKEEG